MKILLRKHGLTNERKMEPGLPCWVEGKRSIQINMFDITIRSVTDVRCNSENEEKSYLTTCH